MCGPLARIGRCDWIEVSLLFSLPGQALVRCAIPYLSSYFFQKYNDRYIQDLIDNGVAVN
ncbi:hypothetical protein COO20_03175 [Thalassospira marina]|uniref:Uncharacterized protein n=1 Tax=Thalassospira marina TaxID=2048283 RepID=A0A2N3KXH7_9PROT|nr:hypothetical protein COO20_03175 [Thalassospira marina]